MENMKTLWCWRCGQDMPMLDDQEYAEALRLYAECWRQYEKSPRRWGFASKDLTGDEFIRRTHERIDEHFRPLQQWYEQLTGFPDCHQNAIVHHRLLDFGDPCRVCGKPLRSPRAKLCAACGAYVTRPVGMEGGQPVTRRFPETPVHRDHGWHHVTGPWLFVLGAVTLLFLRKREVEPMSRLHSQPGTEQGTTGIRTVAFWVSWVLGSLGLAFALLLAQTKGGRSFPTLVFSVVGSLLVVSLLLGTFGRVGHWFVKGVLAFELLFCLYGLWSVATL
jgi:hypothetical protein